LKIKNILLKKIEKSVENEHVLILDSFSI